MFVQKLIIDLQNVHNLANFDIFLDTIRLDADLTNKTAVLYRTFDIQRENVLTLYLKYVDENNASERCFWIPNMGCVDRRAEIMDYKCKCQHHKVCFTLGTRYRHKIVVQIGETVQPDGVTYTADVCA